jgi:transcriptional regulator with XRE-family HTH domain
VDTERVGARLRKLRKLRGVTQAQLAGRANFSASLVRKVEQGTVPPSSAFVAAAARALAVPVERLYGTDDRQMTEESPRAQLDELRAALDAWDDPRPAGDPLSLLAVNARLDEISRQITSTRYADASTALPSLIHHLYVLTEQDGHAGDQARGALHDAYRFSAAVAGRFRQVDLAAIASERHVQLAPLTGDPNRVAISAFHRSSRHLQRGDVTGGLRLLERARRDIDERSPVACQVHLRSAVLAARAGQLDRADEFVDAARAVGQGPGYRGIDATPVNVAVHWCAAPVETMDGAEAVRRGAQVHIVDRSRPERVGHHHIDQARAWLLYGDRDRTLAELNAARAVAPFNTRHHPAVRETVLALAESDRRRTESLAGFARWAGIEL